MKASSIGKKILRVITRQKAVVAIIVMMVMMLFFDTKFYTSYSILEMLRSAAILEIVAFGVTVAVICGGCDLSVGGTLCLGGILAIMVMNAGLPIWLAFVVALAAGAAVGFINGFLVVQQKCEPFIITLGMGILLRVFVSRSPMPIRSAARTPALWTSPMQSSLALFRLLLCICCFWALRFTI